jgi:uncharacterized C2H2 Zn-finger protein
MGVSWCGNYFSKGELLTQCGVCGQVFKSSIDLQEHVAKEQAKKKEQDK